MVDSGPEAVAAYVDLVLGAFVGSTSPSGSTSCSLPLGGCCKDSGDLGSRMPAVDRLWQHV